MSEIIALRNYQVIPQRVKEAREALELTMEELGDLIGVKRQTISNYESGMRSPEPEILMKLVEMLEQPLVFFTTNRPNNLGLKETTFFRSFRSKTARTNRKCEILSDWFVQVVAYLGKFVNFPPVDLPEIPPPKNKKHYLSEEIEQAALICRKHWGLGIGPISNMATLLESKGIIVAYSELGTDVVSAFSFWEGGRPFVFLGADRKILCRARFSAAHELGHLLLHRGISKEDLEADLKTYEKEVDHFASAFLLPRDAYPLEIFSFRLSAFIELKKRWKVSIAAQIHRCFSLGILTEEQYVSLRKHLSKNKWIKQEPLDNTLLIELPKIIEKSLNLLQDNKINNIESILSNIRLSSKTLKKILGVNLKEIFFAPEYEVNLKNK